MKNLKFRAYSFTHKQMFFPTIIDLENKGVFWRKGQSSDNGEWLYGEEEFVLMAFTGRKDCKGKEIYDGDLIDFDEKEWGGRDNVHTVSWDNDSSEWSFGGGSSGDMGWRTVVGNIHEELKKNVINVRSEYWKYFTNNGEIDIPKYSMFTRKENQKVVEKYVVENIVNE